MADDRPDCQCGVVRPVECLKAGWQLIKDDYWLFLGITVVAILIASLVPFGILAGPMMCGLYYCLLRRARGKSVKFEMLFRGFDHFVQSLIATLIMIVPAMLVLVPAYIIFIASMIASMPQPQPGAKPDPSAATGFLIGYFVFILALILVQIVISVLFFFVYPLIVDRKLSGVQAVMTSFRAARSNFGGVLGLVLLTTLLNILGSLACCIGQFFVAPIHFAAVAVAYRLVFPDEPAPEKPPTDAERDYDDRVQDEPPSGPA